MAKEYQAQAAELDGSAVSEIANDSKLVAKGDRPQIAYTSVAIRRTLAATIGTDTPRQYAAVTASDLSILGNSLTLSGLATSLTLANQITDSGFAYRGLGTRGATRPRLNVGR